MGIVENQFTEKQLLEYSPIISNPKPFIQDYNTQSNVSPYPFNQNNPNLTELETDYNKNDIENDIENNIENIEDNIENNNPINIEISRIDTNYKTQNISSDEDI